MIIFLKNLKTKSDQNTYQNACPRTPLAKCISKSEKEIIGHPSPKSWALPMVILIIFPESRGFILQNDI